jgi:hypothetical protein
VIGRAARLGAVVLAPGLLACDAIGSASGSGWTPVETNGARHQLHFVMNATDVRISLPEHVRVERVETKKNDGTGAEERRERSVRVLKSRCDDNILCDAVPNPSVPGEIVVTGRKYGETTLRVEAILDDKDEVKDTLAVRVLP